jgi:hypothetical protein
MSRVTTKSPMPLTPISVLLSSTPTTLTSKPDCSYSGTDKRTVPRQDRRRCRLTFTLRRTKLPAQLGLLDHSGPGRGPHLRRYSR